jgi:hypothetical protein
MEDSKMNLRIRQLKRPAEEHDKIIEILKRIKEHHSDKEQLILAINNSLFLHTLAAIELLRPDLEFSTKPFYYNKDKEYLTDMVRYDIDMPKGSRKSLVWVYFPSGKSEFNTVHCRLQKFGYTSSKVDLSGPTDNRGYPTLKVHDFPDIDELIGCLNEVISNP